ncbi:MAG: hypothetical protein JXQ83_10955 [Candidatus Glassbacteria bacterium]|nr:hypothetical protein [Candidatus Glassbacteria bacterium]
MDKRIVLVGAGSAIFTRGLLGSLVLDPGFEEATLVLMDVAPGVLSLVEGYARKLVRDNGYGLKIEASADLAAALDGADFVVCTVAADDREARKLEIEVPMSFGYHHSWGDTTGPSGVFRALRHIPIFLKIAGEMEHRCPEAWLLNYTNPMAALCRAVSAESKVKVIGFCDGPPYFRRMIGNGFLGLPEGSLKIKAAGVDHLVWLLEMSADGEDVYPLFRRQIERVREKYPASTAIWEAYGYFPLPGDEHISEFFPFLLRDEQTMRQYGLKDMDIRWHRLRRAELGDAVRREASEAGPIRPMPLPPEEEVLQVICSIANDEKKEFVASLPNLGVIANLPEYAVVEAPVLLGAGIEQLPPVFLPPGLTGPLYDSIIKDELVVEAALTGSRETVFRAVLACPLITSPGQAGQITSVMLEALEDYLPVRFR